MWIITFESMKQPYLIIFVLCFLNIGLTAVTDVSLEVDALLKDSDVPSMAVAAIVDGELVMTGVSGVRRKGAAAKATIHDKYHVGSNTKSMTATLAAILVKEGKIKWDTTIGDVFSGIKVHSDYKKVTLRQLLKNTGGVVGDVPADLWSKLWEGKGSLVKQRLLLVKGIVGQAPANEPGSSYEYSNAGFSIAGAMLEAVTHKLFEALMTEKLFKPLGMDSAGFRAPATNGKVDQPYGHFKRLFQVTSIDPEPAGDNPAGIAPAGAVHCSILDYVKYARFHLGVTHTGLLSSKERKELYRPSTVEDYAMGWITVKREWAKGVALTHTGSNTMFTTTIWLAPNRNFAAIAMSNYGENEAVDKCDEAIEMLIEKCLK